VTPTRGGTRSSLRSAGAPCDVGEGERIDNEISNDDGSDFCFIFVCS